jgi:hypothetical protein
MTLETLRFGILARGTVLSAWQVECILALEGAGGARLALVIELARRGPHAAMKPPDAQLFRLYEQRVRRRSRALRPVAFEPSAEAAPRLVCKTPNEAGDGDIAAGDIAAIRDRRLDFIVAFAGDARVDVLADTARYGVWRYRYGGASADDAMRSCFWAAVEDHDVFAVALERLAAAAAEPELLFEGHFTVRGRHARALDQIYLGSADWCARACRDTRLDQPGQPAFATAGAPLPERAAPTNSQILGLALMGSIGIPLRAWRWLFHLERWHVAIVNARAEDLVDGLGAAVVNWLPTPGYHRFWADPFCLASAGDIHVLVEDFSYFRGRAHISAVTTPRAGAKAGVLPVIDTGTHMSYPFLFEHGGSVYCMPEIHETNGVRLYHAVRFPEQWELVGTMIDGFPAVDSTVFEHDGLWWLFCGRAGAFSHTKLYAWHAESPHGPWNPHLLNPIKCDVRSSRPAGPAFVAGGALLRPAQDCSRTYGGAVTMNRVVRLSRTAFEEEMVGRIEPDPEGPYPHGLHTLCPSGDVTLIDGKHVAFDLAAPVLKLCAAVRERWRRRVGRPSGR